MLKKEIKPFYKPCPECKQEIIDTAKVCHNCFSKLTWFGKFGAWIPTIISGILLLATIQQVTLANAAYDRVREVEKGLISLAGDYYVMADSLLGNSYYFQKQLNVGLYGRLGFLASDREFFERQVKKLYDAWMKFRIEHEKYRPNNYQPFEPIMKE